MVSVVIHCTVMIYTNDLVNLHCIVMMKCIFSFQLLGRGGRGIVCQSVF